MDDSFVSPRPEVEVYWDCESPTPAVWKKHQRPASTEKPKYTAQDVRSSKFTTSYPNHFLQAQKALSANNQLDGDFLAIAKKMVEKLRESESGGVSSHPNENVCSMDAVFDMSGQSEQLASLESDIPTTVTVPNTSSLSTSIDLTNVNIDCNWGDDDDDDLFTNVDDGIEKQHPFQAYATRKSPLHFTATVGGSNVSSSTPLRRSPQKQQRPSSSIAHKNIQPGNENCSKFFLPAEKEKLKSSFNLRVKRTPSPHRARSTKNASLPEQQITPKRSGMKRKTGLGVSSNKEDATVWGDSITDDVLADFMLEDSWDEFVSDDNSAPCNSEQSKHDAGTSCSNQTLVPSSTSSFTRVTTSSNTRPSRVSTTSIPSKSVTVPSSSKNSDPPHTSACSSSTSSRVFTFRKSASTTAISSHQTHTSSNCRSSLTHSKTASKNHAHRSLFPTNDKSCGNQKENVRKVEPLKTVQEKDGFFSDDDDLLMVYDQFQSSQQNQASNLNQQCQSKTVAGKPSSSVTTKSKPPHNNNSKDGKGPENKKARCSPDEIARKRQMALEKLKKRKAKTSSSRKTILF